MNKPLAPEAAEFEHCLHTFVSVLAERDRLRTELEAEREQSARLHSTLKRFVEFLGDAGTILSEGIAEPSAEPQTMRTAIVDYLRTPVSSDDKRKFAEIWGGEAPAGEGNDAQLS